MPKPSLTPNPKQALRNWAERNEIYPARLARELHCTEAHAWEILKGDRAITLPTLARLLVVYGKDGPALAIAEAMKVQLDTLYNAPETVAA